MALTGEQLVRIAIQARTGQTIIVTGALGSVGRAAVHVAKKLSIEVIAGVRARQLAEAESLGASSMLALDDDDAIARLQAVDGVADTVGGETAARLFGKVKGGGRFGYASMLPDGLAGHYPTVAVTRVFARPDPSKLREFADDIRDGKFALPISQHLPLQRVGAAHETLEKGGGGKIVLTFVRLQGRVQANYDACDRSTPLRHGALRADDEHVVLWHRRNGGPGRQCLVKAGQVSEQKSRPPLAPCGSNRITRDLLVWSWDEDVRSGASGLCLREGCRHSAMFCGRIVGPGCRERGRQVVRRRSRSCR